MKGELPPARTGRRLPKADEKTTTLFTPHERFFSSLVFASPSLTALDPLDSVQRTDGRVGRGVWVFGVGGGRGCAPACLRRCSRWRMLAACCASIC